MDEDFREKLHFAGSGGKVKKETKIRIKQFFCNHDYICKGGDFDEEGKVIRFYLKCKKLAQTEFERKWGHKEWMKVFQKSYLG